MTRNRCRSVAKTYLARALHRARVDRALGRHFGRRGEPLVVGYHRVVDDFSHSSQQSIAPMLTSAATFEKHLEWIGRRYKFVSLDELTAILAAGGTAGKPVAAVTFDDGYQDVYRNAVPILRRKGIPSAIFVVSDLVGTRQLLVHDELHLLLSALLSRDEQLRRRVALAIRHSDVLAEDSAALMAGIVLEAADAYLAVRSMLETFNQSELRQAVVLLGEYVDLDEGQKDDFLALNWEMLEEMSGLDVTIGSHTKSHVLLANETADDVREEVAGSRRDLEQHLGVDIRHFAYPDGSFNEQTIEAVAAAGYHTAHTVCAHQDAERPLLTISRKMLWQNACVDRYGDFSPDILSCMVNGIFDPAGKCRAQHWA